MMIKKINIMEALVILALVFLFGVQQADAKIYGISGPTFNLRAMKGNIIADDGKSIFMWGFANASTARVRFQYPGPTLIVNQGQTVTVNLTNTLPVPVSIVFPGQNNVNAVGGVPGMLTREAPPGGSVSYTFAASEPGTYIYYSGTRPELQVEMGLLGALIVRPAAITTPAGFAGCAYNTVDSCYHREYLQLLTDIDHTIHDLVLLNKTANVDNTIAYPVYWFINGRAGLDTVAKNFAPYLPYQPYSAMARMHPGEKILVRMIGGVRDLHPHHMHGNQHYVIARDGRILKGPAGEDLSEGLFTTTVAPGQTTDALFTWTGENIGWDIYGTTSHTCNPGPDNFDPVTKEYCPNHGKPLPVGLPDQNDLTFGIFYSGSPYIGSPGALPPGEGGLNPTAGLFFMWHSHNEKELTTNNIFPGGMMTWASVEYPSVILPAE
ncbi:MAG: multicopper oxidase domain-containing protein [Thermodesulfovibrionales bacterium]|nr:multicopper oxidase domain-containing protein [Thermodesulfovibrionales bacterium]